jgi:starch phosphorylase
MASLAERGVFLENNLDYAKEAYLASIDRQDLADVITPSTPIAIFSMECYRHDMPAQGGLGMVVGDWSYIYGKIGLPVAIITPFYNKEIHQVLDENHLQREVALDVAPEDKGFTRINNVNVRLETRSFPDIEVPIYEKRERNVHIIAPSHEYIEDVYNGKTNSYHRLFQEVIEGFGGHKAMVQLGYEPPLFLLNEAPVIFAAISEVDRLISQGLSITEAMSRARDKSVYINHTLVQAEEAVFTWDQFEEEVFPNIQDGALREWVASMFSNDGIRLSTMALELSGKRRGVSMLHAQEASQKFHYANGEPVPFDNNTNGISAERWAHPMLFHQYLEAGILNQFESIPDDYQRRIFNLDEEKLRQAKNAAGEDLISKLRNMRDQNGNPIEIPKDSLIVGWARRAAAYKRPDLPFKRPEVLAAILEKHNAHFFISGKAHTEDDHMKWKIKEICDLIDSHPVLAKRVHFIQDYNEEVSRPLIRGAHVWINNPTVRWPDGSPRSTEADGTSKDKGFLNNVILVSTEDGGMKDAAIIEELTGKSIIEGDKAPYYLRVEGSNDEAELDSLYSQIDRALNITEGRDREYSWGAFVKRQLAANLEIISGGRWVADELRIGLPKKAQSL